jgi:hypothetical protein
LDGGPEVDTGVSGNDEGTGGAGGNGEDCIDAEVCAPEMDATFCARLSKNCGRVTANDSCGRERTVISCGDCTSPAVCGGDGSGVCGVPSIILEPCTPESDAALCARFEKNCGGVTALDNCDQSRTVVGCGDCASPRTCGGSGIANVCGGTADCVHAAGPSALPFAVDEYFGITGSMGDAITEDGCPVRAPTPIPGAECWTARYLQTEGGVYDHGRVDWQYPVYEGPMYGRVIPPGATKVHFFAWGAAGGELIEFAAGSGGDGANGSDGFRVSTTVTLTTEPTAYEVSLAGVQYTCHSVYTAFSWFSNQPSPATFYIDDIQWQ